MECFPPLLFVSRTPEYIEKFLLPCGFSGTHLSTCQFQNSALLAPGPSRTSRHHFYFTLFFNLADLFNEFFLATHGSEVLMDFYIYSNTLDFAGVPLGDVNLEISSYL
jgi:hypothetical protein